MAKEKSNKTAGKKRDRISRLLYLIYLIFLVVSIVVIAQVIHIQIGFKPDPTIESVLTPKVKKVTIEPNRGNILACDGRVLAMSFPSYNLYMDCTVQKDVFAKDSKKGAQREKAWKDSLRLASYGIARIFPEEYTAESFYSMVIEGRATGNKHKAFGHSVDNETLNEIRKLPLFKEGQFKGGLIAERHNIRQYPYDRLGRRVIGYIRTNSMEDTKSRLGIEGKFDYALHGTEGYEWMRVADESSVHDFDSVWVKPVDGEDVRTTLDVDIQDMLDNALRGQIADNEEVEGACGIVMEVKTGAIRAMVNLRRDDETGLIGETYNYAIGRLGEPGSVFKVTTLMSAIEDGYVETLDMKIPTNHGMIKNYPLDQHIMDYERNYHTNEITILKGLEMSSNYVFCYLATHFYGGKPKEFINKLYSYKMGEAFDFDIDGFRTPVLPDPDSKSWSPTNLGTVGYGYTVNVTPLHVLTFYNAIANKGKMMKPYLVEDFEHNGKVTTKRGPSVLNAQICSRATADTITRGLKGVTEEGTATRLKHASWKVAGKTGTARILLDAEETGTGKAAYTDKDGRKKNQGTFVGFFPADDPQYSIIVTIYSKISSQSFYGGTIPALAVKDVVDGIYAISTTWSETIESTAKMPKVTADDLSGRVETPDSKTHQTSIPDVKGLGLQDAIYVIENSGLKCSFSGTGHVVGQSPKAGTKAKAGETVTITLK